MGRVSRGSGDVFTDLGFADASERSAKLRLAQAINVAVAERAAIRTAISSSRPKRARVLRAREVEGSRRDCTWPLHRDPSAPQATLRQAQGSSLRSG
jgi:hypothetical protein